MRIKSESFDSSIGIGFTRRIDVGEKRHKSLIAWLKHNGNGWKNSGPISHAYPDVSVQQNSFQLLVYEAAAVVRFVDTNKKQRDYGKQIAKGELDFLLK